MSNAHNEIYEFDKFRLEVSERILWRDNERVPLPEKAFETLCALVKRGNHLVSKDELLAEIWANTIVEENNLDKNISLLRQVLGERSDKGKFIETVRGHGYRFVADVHLRSPGEPLVLPVVTRDISTERQASAELESPIPHPESVLSQDQNPSIEIQKTNRWWLVAVAGGLIGILSWIAFYGWRVTEQSASSPIKTIAVLPFKSLGAESRNEALEMGMADTLIAKLGGEEIIVRPLGSVSRYAALTQDSILAGRELNVETVLDGTIQTADNRIRISARLFRTSDGKQLWTGKFDEKFTDIFAVQDSISERVATALKIQFSGREKKRQTDNVEAYQLYMKGHFHALKSVKSEIETGVSYFQQAIKADPNYAFAYVGLADAYRGLAVGGETPSAEFFPPAKAAANKAIELDDTLAEAHAVLAHIMFWYDWDWPAAEAQYKRALELNPNNADALYPYAHFLSNMGRHAEALPKIKRARELDPLNLRINTLEGLFLFHAGQPDEAIARLQKTLELDSNFRLANMFIARVYIGKGMFAEALAATSKARELSPVSSEPIAFGSYALAQSGKLTEARAALDELLHSSTERYVPPYHIALAYNALGESDKALIYLEKGFAEKDVRMVFLKVEPRWNNLRKQPRFIELMRRMNFE